MHTPEEIEDMLREMAQEVTPPRAPTKEELLALPQEEYLTLLETLRDIEHEKGWHTTTIALERFIDDNAPRPTIYDHIMKEEE